MIHTKHIMLGRNAEHILSNIYRYLLKYEPDSQPDKKVTRFFEALLYVENEDGSADFLAAREGKEDENTFQAGIEEILNVSFENCEKGKIPVENRDKYLSSFFAELHGSTVTIDLPAEDNALHIFLYVPIYESKWVTCAESFLKAIEPHGAMYKVDFILLSPDMAFLFNDEKNCTLKVNEYKETAKESLGRLLDMKRQFSCLSHMICMQNINSDGVALALNEDSLGRIFGEYAMLTVTNYLNIFRNTQIPPTDPHQIHSFGLSVLNFDKYYFVQYLLHKAYKTILERENVIQEDVDINKVSKIVQDLLKDRVRIFSNIYSEFVKPKLEDKISPEEIMSQFGEEWKIWIEKLTDDFQSYIDSEELTLPEKRAALAQLLGEDDELLIGNMFNRKQFVLDDCSVEILDLFTNYNNMLLSAKEEPVVKIDPVTGEQHVEASVDPDPIESYAVLSSDAETPSVSAGEYVAQMKELKTTMKSKLSYIRNATNELDSLQQQGEDNENSKKRLTDEGFVFEGKVYKLQNDVKEIPCSEDYEPKQNDNKEVDLRKLFTPIKDQGQLGACASFAILSVYEHIHKKNKNEDIDLSEYFLYYNARARNGEANGDSGSSLYHNLESMTQEGACLESLCKYRTDLCDERPTEEAYSDAVTRKVKKALNVKCDLADIKSALAEGYPVVVSLKIFESFEPVAGFIPMPSADEKQDEKHGNHAMVLCGYSDDKKVFIVRNSWGTAFGDRGYCYIPYSYISDPNLLNVACIITEISEAQLVVVGGVDNKVSVYFDERNTEIRKAILRNLIEETKIEVVELQAELDKLTISYHTLFGELGNHDKRFRIMQGTVKRLQSEKSKVEERKRTLENERVEALDNFDGDTKWGRIYFGASVVGVVLLFGLLTHFYPTSNVLFNWLSYLVYAVSAAGVVLYSAWENRRKRCREELNESYMERIARLEAQADKLAIEIYEVPLRLHVAGVMIDSFWKLSKNLHKKYNSMRSYIGNLKVWFKEENELHEMSPMTRQPFLSIISNDSLDSFYKKYEQRITADIRLHRMMKGLYEISEKAIIKFKRDMKQQLRMILGKVIADFSIYDHITGAKKYEYVDALHNSPSTLLPLLDRKSRVFTRISETAIMGQYCSKFVFCKTKTLQEQANWRTMTTPHFSTPPSLCDSGSDDRVTLVHFEILKETDIVL